MADILEGFMYRSIPITVRSRSVGLLLFACWDCGFESRRGHEWLSVVIVVCCTDTGLCDGPVTRLDDSSRMYVCLTFIGPCIVIYSYSTTNKMHLLSQIIYSCKTLYMFRTDFLSIIRSSKLRIEQRYMSNSCCYLL